MDQAAHGKNTFGHPDVDQCQVSDYQILDTLSLGRLPMTALFAHESLDAVSNLIVAAGGLILMTSAVAITSTLIIEIVRTFHTFGVLRRLT